MLSSADRIDALQTMLGSETAFTTAELTLYLDMADREILEWLYNLYPEGVPEDAMLPDKYDIVSLHAVLAALNIQGAEGQSVHIENGTHRHFKHADMVDYIRKNVTSYARVV